MVEDSLNFIHVFIGILFYSSKFTTIPNLTQEGSFKYTVSGLYVKESVIGINLCPTNFSISPYVLQYTHPELGTRT